LLGLIALAGMIMRNTVILVDQIEHESPRVTRATARSSTPRAARASVVLTALAASSA